jgi:hypothetical protein
MKNITLTQDELYCLLNDAFQYKADLEFKKQYNKETLPNTPGFEINEFIKSHNKIKHLKY